MAGLDSGPVVDAAHDCISTLLLESVREARESKDIMRLQEALEQAKKGGLDDRLLEPCWDLLHEWREEQAAAKLLKAALRDTKHDTVALRETIDAAERFEALAPQVAAAKSIHEKWCLEERVRGELASAIASQDADVLNATIQQAQGLGLSVKTAKKVLDLLQVGPLLPTLSPLLAERALRPLSVLSPSSLRPLVLGCLHFVRCDMLRRAHRRCSGTI
jgi:chorismate mutase